MILPELDPIPAVELLLAGQLADFVIRRATLPAYPTLDISEAVAGLQPDNASGQMQVLSCWYMQTCLE